MSRYRRPDNRPRLAGELMSVHPLVTAERTGFGSIMVAPAFREATPYLGTTAMLYMAHLEGERPGSALCIAGRPHLDGPVETEILIPTLGPGDTFGSVDDMVVARDGGLNQDEQAKLIRMAQEGVCLLDDLRSLREEERQRLGVLPRERIGVWDNMREPEPTFTPATFHELPPLQQTLATLVVARHTLLEV